MTPSIRSLETIFRKSSRSYTHSCFPNCLPAYPWSESALINVWPVSKYFNSMDSTARSLLLTSRSRVEKSSQFLFWEAQLSVHIMNVLISRLRRMNWAKVLAISDADLPAVDSSQQKANFRYCAAAKRTECLIECHNAHCDDHNFCLFHTPF